MAGRRRQSGVSFPELLIVVAILGMAAMVAIPSIQESVRFAQARNVATGLEQSLRAARMIAVSRQQLHRLTIDPVARRFVYEDLNGVQRREDLPPRVVFESPSVLTNVDFAPNGAVVGGGASFAIKGAVSEPDAYTDRWTIVLSIAGTTEVTREEIDPPEAIPP